MEDCKIGAGIDKGLCYGLSESLNFNLTFFNNSRRLK